MIDFDCRTRHSCGDMDAAIPELRSRILWMLRTHAGRDTQTLGTEQFRRCL